jgi:hypothetical protein
MNCWYTFFGRVVLAFAFAFGFDFDFAAAFDFDLAVAFVTPTAAVASTKFYRILSDPIGSYRIL